MKEETIAAISTPFGESGIGIVRISGPLAEPIASRIFKPRKTPFSFIPHHFHYGEIIDPEKKASLDEVLIVLMKSPATYTREDVVEIHCHGGYLILRKVLELVLGQGARMAEAGEFTKRAFLNGRIDLTRAEAVIDLIKAKSTAGLEIANQQLQGALFREISALKEKLVEHLTLIEAHIDFPEEEIEPILLAGMKEGLREESLLLDNWVASYEDGKFFREGISCAITGKTNVGKSSLLNVLLKEERAIVTPFPGTTRDVIEEVLNIRGIPVRLMDTAGLRKTQDLVEREGVRRTKEKVADADLVLLILDGSRELDGDDFEILKELEGRKKVVVLNKSDLPQRIPEMKKEELLCQDPVVQVSALRNTGIEELKGAVYSSLIHREIRNSAEYLIVTNVRHKMALSMAKESLLRAMDLMEVGAPLELTAFEIRSALDALGELVGETVTEDILNRIFDQFCIGK
jgi:tRNA modification GTPase